jgi:hypothetical protein
MADNVVLNAGAGGVTAAADDVGGVIYQRIKLCWGVDGVAVDASATNPLPVTLSLAKAEDAAHVSADSGVPMLAVRRDTATVGSDTDGDYSTLNVNASGQLWTAAVQSGAWNITNISGTVSLPTGAATAANQTTVIGHLDGVETLLGTIDADTGTLAGAVAGTEMQVDIVAALPAGTNNIGDVDVLTLPALPAGTNAIGKLAANSGVDIGDVDVTSVANVVPGTGATNLGKLEDGAHASGDVGVMALAVRRDANTALVGADGDYAPLQVSATGNLKVAIIEGAGSGGTSIADGATFTRNTTSATPAAAVVESTAPTLTAGDAAALSMTEAGALRVEVASGGIEGVAEDAASAGGEEGVAMLAVRRDAASSGVSADGDFAFLSVTSDGSLRVSGGGGGTQYAEDVAHTTGDTGTLALAVRRDTAAVGSGADGDYSTLNVDSSGRLHVNVGNTVTVAAHAVTNAGTFAVQVDGAALTALQLIDNIVLVEDAVAAGGESGVMMLAVRRDAASSGVSADGDFAALSVDSNGALRVTQARAASRCA